MGTQDYSRVEKNHGVLSTVQTAPIEKLEADIEVRSITDGHAGDVSVQIVRPPDTRNTSLSVVTYSHGGGWVLGGSDTHDRLARKLADGAQIAFVFVNYTPSPEAKYPVPLEQAYTIAKWVAENGRTINVNLSRLAVVGDSVQFQIIVVIPTSSNPETRYLFFKCDVSSNVTK